MVAAESIKNAIKKPLFFTEAFLLFVFIAAEEELTDRFPSL